MKDWKGNGNSIKNVLRFIISTVLWTVASVAFVFFMLWGLFKIAEDEYNEALNNPPSRVFVEENLEDIFLTKQVEVVCMEQACDYAIYEVKANGYRYKVLYELRKTEYFGCFVWRYARHTQIQECLEDQGL